MTARLMPRCYVQSVTADAGDSIEAILLVGSLAMNSYVPGQSDIDQITILRDSASKQSERRLFERIRAVRTKFGGSINLAPVIYHSSNLQRPWQNEWDYLPETKHLVCVPEELLRIHDHGQILYGPQFKISRLPKPTMEEMMRYHNRWRTWNAEVRRKHPELPGLRDPIPPPIAVQIILSNAIWHYYYATGQTCFDKHQIASRLRSEVPNYRFQEGVELAHRIRKSGLDSVLLKDLGESLSMWCKHFRKWSNTQPVRKVPLKLRK